MECCFLGQNWEGLESFRQGGDRAVERGNDWKTISPTPHLWAKLN